MGLAKWSPVAPFILSRPRAATRTALIMLIYSNGIVIMWQRLAVLSVASVAPSSCAHGTFSTDIS